MISLFAMLSTMIPLRKKMPLCSTGIRFSSAWDPNHSSTPRETLQVAVIDEMEKNGWKGVCCEPNCVFVVCNQFPVIYPSSLSI